MKGIHIFQKVIPNLWQNALPVVGGSRGRNFYIYIIMVLGLTLFPLPYQEVESMYPAPNNL